MYGQTGSKWIKEQDYILPNFDCLYIHPQLILKPLLSLPLAPTSFTRLLIEYTIMSLRKCVLKEKIHLTKIRSFGSPVVRTPCFHCQGRV